MRQNEEIRAEGQLSCVPLTQGFFATIDAADAQLVSELRWFAKVCTRADGTLRVYAIAKVVRPDGKWTTLRMHRLIAGTPKGLETDHINGDGLDNRRANLRHATTSQNQQNRGAQANNTSGFKGVSWSKADRKWRARINGGGKQSHLGMFDSAEAAYAAYCEAASSMHGEFARAVSDTLPRRAS